MTDIRPEDQRPAPYVVANRREWLVCEEPGMEGLAVLVRTGITNAEQRALKERYDAIIDVYQPEWDAMAPDARDLDDAPWIRQQKLLAPYILDWNAQGIDGATGEASPLPPPSIAGHQAFDCISPEEYLWMFQSVVGGYYITGKVTAWRRASGTGGSTSALASDSLSENVDTADPTALPNSSPPSASASKRSGRGSTTG